MVWLTAKFELLRYCKDMTRNAIEFAHAGDKKSIRTYSEQMSVSPPVSLSNTVEWLFLDLNSFFASCEQQDNPAWRGRPLIVVPAENVETTCAIAASIEAKRLGIKTGTAVWEAKQKCPGLIIVAGGHRRYVEYHNQIMAAIESCLHVDHVMSIDECACRLLGDEQMIENAVRLAQKVKTTIRQQVGECLTSSIGLAPNRFMAKVASNMQKPNGLTVLTRADLPQKILHLTPRDLPGIGPRMEQRLDRHGIFTMADLYAADVHMLRTIWNGIEGERMHQKLRGIEPYRPPSTPRVIGHEHVLEPALRNRAGLQAFAHHLLAKAAERLRGKNLACQRLGFYVKWQMPEKKWTRSRCEISFHATSDTLHLIRILNSEIMAQLPPLKPFCVGVMLADFVPAGAVQGDLFTPTVTTNLSPALDKLNDKYGRGTVYFGGVEGSTHGRSIHNFSSRIAFQRVPKLSEYDRRKK